ncbi:MAG: SCO family protein [Candidatus Binatia bacterium]|jgi:protein SCO1/2
MNDVDFGSSHRLPWLLLVLALLLPASLWFRDASRHGAPTPRGAKVEELADFGVVPDFSLTERSGRALTRADLAGGPWIADFVFANCPGACPLLSGEMASLHRRLGDRVRLVSFSVDPARDTPQALTAYADRFGASRTSWLFVTGPVAPMRQLIGRGFHLAVADPPADEPGLAGAITHSEKIVLVDADLHIRRYYDGGTGLWIEAAIADLAKLGVTTLEAVR